MIGQWPGGLAWRCFGCGRLEVVAVHTQLQDGTRGDGPEAKGNNHSCEKDKDNHIGEDDKDTHDTHSYHRAQTHGDVSQ